MPDKELILIKDFIDFNYVNIAFDITCVDIQLLESKLREDSINHLWEFEDSNYIAIWNCDLQGFAELSDIRFDRPGTYYQHALLEYNDGKWFYSVTNPYAIIPEASL